MTSEQCIVFGAIGLCIVLAAALFLFTAFKIWDAWRHNK